jgi:hypothetical protein
MKLLTAFAIIAVLLLQGAVIAKEKEEEPTRYERIQAVAKAETDVGRGDPYRGCDWREFTRGNWGPWGRAWDCLWINIGGGGGGGGAS